MRIKSISRLPYVLLSLMAAACAAEGPTLSTSSGPFASAQVGPSEKVGANLSPEEVAASGPAVPMNPFADVTAQTGGGREVIADLHTIQTAVRETASLEPTNGNGSH